MPAMYILSHIVDLASWQVILFLGGTFLSSAVDSFLEWKNTLGSGLKERLVSLRRMHPIAEKLFSDRKISQSEKYQTDSRNLSNFSDSVCSGIETLVLLFGVAPLAVHAMFTIFPDIRPCVGIALSFFAVSLVGKAWEIPFSYLDTFKVEARHGFNRMSRKTFFADEAKGIVLQALFAVPASAACAELLFRFGDATWENFWLILAAFVAAGPVVEAFNVHVAMRLFFRFEPLKKGSLRKKLEKMLSRNNMEASSIVVMDSGKKTGHVNAFVHGIGSRKRIVLFDELLEKLSEDEVVAVVAHEIGHAKLHHILWQRLAQVASAACLVGISIVLMNDISLYRAFGYRFVLPEEIAGFRYVGFMLSTSLVGAVSWIFSPLMARWSRRMEKEADAFAARSSGKDPLRTALMKLSSDNLSNISPDPAYEAWNCSHPSILPRLEAIGEIVDENEKWTERRERKASGRNRRKRKTRRNLREE